MRDTVARLVGVGRNLFHRDLVADNGLPSGVRARQLLGRRAFQVHLRIENGDSSVIVRTPDNPMAATEHQMS